MFSVLILVLEVLLLFILQEIGITSRPAAFIIILIALFSVGYICDVQKDEEMSLLQTPLILGYLLRLFLVFFDVYGKRFYTLPNSGADTEMFYRGAISVAGGGESNRGFFVYVVGYLFRYLGVSRLYIQFLLMLCSMVAIHMGDKTMRVFEIDEDTRYSVLMVVCLLPNFAIMSSILLRESIVTMFIAISIFFFACLIRKGDEAYFLLAIASAFCAMRFHSGAIAVAVGYIIARLIYNKRKNTVSLSAFSVISAFFILLISVYLLNRYGDLFIGKLLSVDSLGDIANTNSIGGSSYAKYVGNSENLLNMLLYTIPRIVFFLFSPLPFQWRGLSDVIAFFFSSLFYILIIYETIKYLIHRTGSHHTIVQLLFIVAFASMFVFAWGVSNAGTAVRHRDKMIILYGVIYALVETDKSHDTDVERFKYIKPKERRYFVF